MGPSVAGLFDRRGQRRSRILLAALITGIAVLLFVQPLAIAPGASSGSPAAGRSTTSPLGAAPGETAAPTSAALAGETPSGVPTNLPNLVSAERHSLAEPGSASNLPAAAGLSQGHATVPTTAPATSLPPSSTPATAATSRILPAGGALDYGYITGTIEESPLPHAFVEGATVNAEPLVGFCPPAGCLANQTNTYGQFKIEASTGENEVLVQDSYYMTNRTWTYVSSGAIDNVGTILLIPDGYVTGVIRGADPSHELVPAINVTASTRDGTFTATPSAHSNSLGEFTVAVPPVPSIVTFTPIFAGSPYEPNQTFVNVSSGRTIDIGTVYLNHPTLVSVEIDDSVSGAPITPAFDTAAALTVCSKVTGYCAEQGNAVAGPILTAFAPVGPDSFTVEALGFVTNSSSLGWVPAEPLGSSPISFGVVDLVPDGGISLFSNVTGVLQPYGSSYPSSLWPVPQSIFGTIYVTDCSLDAVYTGELLPTGNLTTSDCDATCINPGEPALMLGFPLRNFFELTPATSTECYPYAPTWPIPPDLPVFPNWDWANVTPAQTTWAGNVGLLPGTYVEGQVLPYKEVGWSVQACSTDEPSVCGPGVYSDYSYLGDPDNQPPQGCPPTIQPGANVTFCVPAPPGPDLVQVESPNASSNFTWVTNPPLAWHQLPLLLGSASTPSVQSINLTSARLSGRVLQARSLTPVGGLPAVVACPAGTPAAGVSCANAAVNRTGSFSLWAPIGWDRVTVTAPNYVTNSTWVYVEHSNSTGTILLTPFGSVVGRVVDPDGVGIYEATVKICPATAPTGCEPLGGTGFANTGGYYYGTIASGALPLGSYQVIATATGYSTDWTWLNVTTPGQNFTAPTIVLDPLSGSPPVAGPLQRAGPPAGNGTASTGEWVSGTIVDADHAVPLTSATVAANPVDGAPPILLSSLRSTGGEFNDSLPEGLYNVTISQTGFYSVAFFLNVSGNGSTIALGTFALEPFPTITGRIVIGPAAWVAGVTDALGLGPGQGTVEACTNLATVCESGTVDSSGDFNISAPVGSYDLFEASGAGTGIGTATGGFNSNKTFFNVTNGTPTRPLLMELDIFGAVSGTVVDSADHATPVRYDGIVADETFPIDLTEPEELSADGNYTIFIAETEQLNMTVGGAGAWYPINASVPTTINTTGGHPHLVLGPGAVLDLGSQFALHHFGWVDVEVHNGLTNAPVPYATVTAAETGYLWNAPDVIQAFGVANAAGFANVTAPPSMPSTQLVALNVSAPDYGYSARNVSVNSSKVTYVGGPYVPGHSLTAVTIDPWGWISGSVSDAATGRALGGVAVSATANAGLLSGGLGIETNGLGHFLTDAPVSPNVELSLSLVGYTSNLTRYNVTTGASIVAPPVHLTGDGIVEGRVVASPGGAPVAGATVQVCKSTELTCGDTVTTNSSGIFVIGAAATIDSIEVSAPGFVSNTPQTLPVASDTWTWAGVVSLYQYATVLGTIVGLPAGFPLSDANASLCGLPANGQGAGPCVVTVQTGATGEFSVQAAAGLYVLQANTTFYNDTYLTLSLSPGESLNVGTLFVEEYGTMSGTVESGSTDGVVAGATVSACENWGAGTCINPTTSGPDGSFLLGGPSGPYTVEVVAAGYQTAYARVTLGVATNTFVPTFLLTPIGPGNHYTVTGNVTSASGGPIADAIVAASGGYTSFTDAAGAFSIVLPWGTTELTASSPGFLAASVSRDIAGPMAGVDFVLRPMTYSVTGTVTNGLSGAALSGVVVYENGVAVGNASGASGAFALALTNGTHELLAEPPAGSAWTAESFSVAIDGAPVVHDLALYPPIVTLTGVVVSNLTGTPIVGAALSFAGATTVNIPWSTTATSGLSGRFDFSVYPGTYTLTATESGYASAKVSVTVAVPSNATGTAPPVTVALTPTSTASASTGPTSTAFVWTALTLAIAGAAVVGAILLVRRRGDRPPASPPPLEGR
jgi:hypothetical protein